MQTWATPAMLTWNLFKTQKSHRNQKKMWEKWKFNGKCYSKCILFSWSQSHQPAQLKSMVVRISLCASCVFSHPSFSFSEFLLLDCRVLGVWKQFASMFDPRTWTDRFWCGLLFPGFKLHGCKSTRGNSCVMWENVPGSSMESLAQIPFVEQESIYK